MSRDFDFVLDEPGNGQRVSELWAVVVVHSPDDESVAGIMDRQGRMVPLVVATADRLPMLREQARKIARVGKVVSIVKLSARNTVETYHPDGRRTVPE